MLTDALQIMDTWLSCYRPEVYQRLLPPATEEDFQRVESAIQQPLPEDLKQIYRWRGGQPELEIYGLCLRTGGVLLSLEQVAAHWSMFERFVSSGYWNKNQWRPDWIPFLMTGGGEFFFRKGEAPDAGAILHENDYILSRGAVVWPSVLYWVERMNEEAQQRIAADCKNWDDDFEAVHDSRYW